MKFITFLFMLAGGVQAVIIVQLNNFFFVFGLILAGFVGYYGGSLDTVLRRIK